MLKKIIIHEFKKTANNSIIETVFSEECLLLTDDEIALQTELNNTFRKSTNFSYSIFSSDESFFKSKFHHYYQNRIETESNEDFIVFTKSILTELKRTIPIQAAGGYFIFSEFEERGNHFFSVYLIRDIIGRIFKRDGTNYRINPAIYLNIDKLAVAGIINISIFANPEDRNYIQFISRNTDDVADYFFKWIGTGNRDNSKKFTEKLKEIIYQLPPPINQDTNFPYTHDEVSVNVFRYLISEPVKRNVNLHDLSRHIYGDPETITSFIADRGYEVAIEFKAHPTALKKFKQISVSAEDIHISFPVGVFRNQKIRIEDNKVIIESLSLSEKILQIMNTDE